MRIIVHKEVEGKRRCDDCRQVAPPISECQLPYGEEGKRGYGQSQWIDLCPTCQERVRKAPAPFANLDTFVATPD